MNSDWNCGCGCGCDFHFDFDLDVANLGVGDGHVLVRCQPVGRFLVVQSFQHIRLLRDSARIELKLKCKKKYWRLNLTMGLISINWLNKIKKSRYHFYFFDGCGPQCLSKMYCGFKAFSSLMNIAYLFEAIFANLLCVRRSGIQLKQRNEKLK